MCRSLFIRFSYLRIVFMWLPFWCGCWLVAAEMRLLICFKVSWPRVPMISIANEKYVQSSLSSSLLVALRRALLHRSSHFNRTKKPKTHFSAFSTCSSSSSSLTPFKLEILRNRMPTKS